MKGKISIDWTTILIVSFIVILLCYFYFKGYIVPLDTGLPKDKETLVRYYACSLALCTHGCGSEEVNSICLYNDSVTHECKKVPGTGYAWCSDFCDNPPSDWPYPAPDGADIVCGPNWPLTLPLTGDVYLNCYEDYFITGVSGGGSDFYHYRTDKGVPYYDELVKKENFPIIMGPSSLWSTSSPSGEILDDNCANKNLNPSWECSYSYDIKRYFFPGILRKEGDVKNPWCSRTGKIGVGMIYMDNLQSVEKYGCIGDCKLVPGERFGYERCKIHGELKMWSLWKSEGCADVFFNSSIGSTPKFTFDVHRSAGMEECKGVPSDKCQTIYKNDEAIFDADILNELGTDSYFTLTITSYKHIDINGIDRGEDGTLGCTLPCEGNFVPNSKSFVVENGDTGTSVLKLKPTDVGTYEIYVKAAKPDNYDSQENLISIKVIDFDLWFTIRQDSDVEKDEYSEDFYIRLWNRLDESKDFILNYDCNGPGVCDCINSVGQPFDGTVLTVDSNDIGGTTIKCKSPTPGDYDITVEATTDGDTKSTTEHDTSDGNYGEVYLHVIECGGNIQLDISHSSGCGDCVWTDESFNLEASGVNGCKDWAVTFTSGGGNVGQCLPGAWDGSTCQITTSKDTAGTYTYWVHIDINRDGDTNDVGEEDSDVIDVVVKPSYCKATCGPSERCCSDDCDTMIGCEICGPYGSRQGVCDDGKFYGYYGVYYKELLILEEASILAPIPCCVDADCPTYYCSCVSDFSDCEDSGNTVHTWTCNLANPNPPDCLADIGGLTRCGYMYDSPVFIPGKSCANYQKTVMGADKDYTECLDYCKTECIAKYGAGAC